LQETLLMDRGDNPYSAPIGEAVADPSTYLPDSDPQGFPRPMTLAAIGFVFAVGISAALICAALELIGETAMLIGMVVPPIRLAWVLYTRNQMQSYQETWSPGVRGFVLTVWVLNVLLLCLDGLLILVAATYAVIS